MTDWGGVQRVRERWLRTGGDGGAGRWRSCRATRCHSEWLPASWPQLSEAISSTSADFRKSNERVYMHAVLQQVVLILIKFLLWRNSSYRPADLRANHPIHQYYIIMHINWHVFQITVRQIHQTNIISWYDLTQIYWYLLANYMILRSTLFLDAASICFQ